MKLNGIEVAVGMEVKCPPLARFTDNKPDPVTNRASAAEAICNIARQGFRPVVQHTGTDGIIALVLGGHCASLPSDELLESQKAAPAANDSADADHEPQNEPELKLPESDESAGYEPEPMR